MLLKQLEKLRYTITTACHFPPHSIDKTALAIDLYVEVSGWIWDQDGRGPSLYPWWRQP